MDRDLNAERDRLVEFLDNPRIGPEPKEPTVGGDLPDPSDRTRPTYKFAYRIYPRRSEGTFQDYWEGIMTFGANVDPNEDTCVVAAITSAEVEKKLAEWAVERAKKEFKRRQDARQETSGKLFITMSEWAGEAPTVRYG